MLARLEPLVESLGYELVDVECRVGGRDGVLRVFIDAEDGITLEDCERVSRQVSAWLDVEDPIPGQYRLEVSSPGLDRVLRTPAHFAHFSGEEIKVELAQPLEGRKRFRGRLEALDGEVIVVQVDGVLWRLPLAMIEHARLVPVLD
ncbi:MAG: ribosome maturation factor RimP [Gammaproteobacteria bacterium]|nr:ribosome maturation factor RimP [Gammaproteobacteria bacterium]TVQ48438.1 MAG: ribosome maturation factor RimP [Gammaproteobacteria bacterium]